jgi:macrolide-specific efflux system membrane fusion protein
MNLFKTSFVQFAAFSVKKKLLIIVGIAVLGILLVRMVAGSSKQPQYTTEQAEKGTLITSVSSSGNVSTGSSVSITSDATGIVAELYIKDGDQVTQGDKIADITLDQNSLQKQTAAWASYLSAQNSLAAAQAKLNSLQSALFKANQAFVNDKGIANPSDQDKSDPKYIEEQADWQQAEADYKNQTNVIAQANAALTSAWLSYSQLSSTVTAPASGTISGLTLTAGAPISGGQSASSSTTTGNNANSTSTTSSQSQSLGTIILPQNQIQATVNLTEIDVTKIKVGQKVTMTLDAFPDKTFTGHVSAINTNGSVSSGVTEYPTTISFDSAPSNIYPNMGVNATIITNIKDDVLLVPTSAIQSSNGQSTVRVIKNGQVQTIDVTVGDSNDTQTEIQSGLQEGDMVVTSVVTPTTGSSTTTSPFGGGGGFGGVRAGGGFGGGNATFRTGGTGATRGR